jgi:AcrR family transcriptional regulator
MAKAKIVTERAKGPPAAAATADGVAEQAHRSIGRPTGARAIGKTTLVENTAVLLRSLPPEKLSLTAAARFSGVHLTLIRYYFKDRVRLLTEVGRYLTLKLAAIVMSSEAAASTPAGRLRIRIDAMIDFYFEHPFYHRLMLEVVEAEDDQSANAMIGIWISRTLDKYQEIMGAGVADGTFRQLNVPFTYLAIMGMCEHFHFGMQLFSRAGIEENGPAVSGQYKAFICDLLFNGLSAHPQPD